MEQYLNDAMEALRTAENALANLTIVTSRGNSSLVSILYRTLDIAQQKVKAAQDAVKQEATAKAEENTDES